MVFPRINSVIEVYGYNNSFIESSIPIGMEVVLLSISEVGNEFYYGQRAFLVTENHVQQIEMKPSTPTEIDSAIDKL